MGRSGLRRVSVPFLLGTFAFATPFSIAIAHTSLALACVLLLFDGESRRAAARLTRAHFLRIPVALWVVASLVAVAFAVDPAASATKLKKLALLPLLPLGALPVVRRNLHRILTALIASTAIVAVIGLGQHLAAGGGLDARVRGISGFYMTVAGIFMIVGLLCVGELLSAAKDPRSRRLLFLSVGTLAATAALVGTYTRGSWLGFLVGGLFLLRKNRVLLLCLLAVAATVFTLGPAELRERAASSFDASHPRNVERVLIWEHGLGLLKEHPLTGTGLVVPKELMEREVVTEDGVLRVHSHMHNAFLQVVVTMGVPGLAAFLFLIFSFFRLARSGGRVEISNLWEEGLVRSYPAILIALLVNGLFEWNFGDSELLGLFYLLTGGVLGVESGDRV